MTCSPANIGPDAGRWNSAWSTPSAICAACLRERFGDKVVTPLISAERGFLGRRVFGVAGAAQAGTCSAIVGLAEDLISALEARAMWARMGSNAGQVTGE